MDLLGGYDSGQDSDGPEVPTPTAGARPGRCSPILLKQRLRQLPDAGAVVAVRSGPVQLTGPKPARVFKVPLNVRALIESDGEEVRLTLVQLACAARQPCCLASSALPLSPRAQDYRPLKAAKRDADAGIRGALPPPKHSLVFEPKARCWGWTAPASSGGGELRAQPAGPCRSRGMRTRTTRTSGSWRSPCRSRCGQLPRPASCGLGAAGAEAPHACSSRWSRATRRTGRKRAPPATTRAAWPRSMPPTRRWGTRWATASLPVGARLVCGAHGSSVALTRQAQQPLRRSRALLLSLCQRQLSQQCGVQAGARPPTREARTSSRRRCRRRRPGRRAGAGATPTPT